MRAILLFSISLIAIQAKPQSCETALSHNSVAPLIKALSQNFSQSTSSVWPGFILASAPVIFSNDRDFPDCIVLWSEGKAVATIKPADLPNIPNKLYTFCGPSPMSACPKVLPEAAGLSAVVYRLDNVLDSVSNLGFTSTASNFMTLAHESFHYFGQSMQIKKGLWPVFPSEPGFSLQARDQIEKNCFKSNPQLLSLTRKEFATLREAMGLAINNSSAESVKSKVQEFFNLRSERYASVSEVRIIDGQTDRSCEQAEALMELTEGTAEFVGLQSTLNAGLMSFADIDRWIGLALDAENGPSEPYYRSGAMALIILNKMNTADLKSEIKNLAKASTPTQTILFFLKKWSSK